MGRGKRHLTEPRSRGVEVSCYICGAKYQRLSDLKGRHFIQKHPNVTYRPPAHVPSDQGLITSAFRQRQSVDQGLPSTSRCISNPTPSASAINRTDSSHVSTENLGSPATSPIIAPTPSRAASENNHPTTSTHSLSNTSEHPTSIPVPTASLVNFSSFSPPAGSSRITSPPNPHRVSTPPDLASQVESTANTQTSISDLSSQLQVMQSQQNSMMALMQQFAASANNQAGRQQLTPTVNHRTSTNRNQRTINSGEREEIKAAVMVSALFA